MPSEDVGMVLPIKSDNLYKKVIESIKALIRVGKLKSGDRLPTERNLVEMLGVSRTTIREALRVMEILGIVEVHVGKGTFVSDLSFESVANSISGMLYFEKGNIDSLYEVREMIEVKNAGLAATRADEKDIEKIQKAEKDMKEAVEKPGHGIIEEKFLHLAIAKATHNPILFGVLNLIIDSYLEVFLNPSYDNSIANRERSAISEHSLIIEAIINHDSEAAMEAMKKHILISKESAKKTLFG
jgi:GntR family transcriptional repressor for pyruvate dehydrogenase complex